MKIVELFEDSFKYPIQNWTKILILGALLLLPLILLVFPIVALVFKQYTAYLILFIIFGIIYMFAYLIFYGYGLSVTRETIFGSNDLPDFEFLDRNLVDGFKLMIVNIVYYIIPLIITIIVAEVTGLFSKFAEIIGYSLQASMMGPQNAAALPQIPQEFILSLAVSLLVVGIVAIIVFALATVFFEIAVARLAETGKLSEIFNCREIFNDMGKIGWGKYIVWFILLYLILIVISLILSLLQSIQYLDMIIALLSIILIEPFLLLFSSRALGLIYRESKG